MVSRRTASADFRLNQSSPSASNSTFSNAKDGVLPTSASFPGSRAANNPSSFDHLAKASSSPARLQRPGQNVGRPSMPTTPPPKRFPIRSPPSRQSQHTRRSTCESKTTHVKPRVPYQQQMRGEGSGCLWRASLDPPITQESLSELDLHKIVSDPRLRHDLNFEHEIMFRPNTYGTRGANKKRDEDLYFEALAIEFDRYLRRQTPLPFSLSRSRSSPPLSQRNPSTSSGPPQRVPRMIAAIREVVKTLVPADKWQTVDDQFDVDLRMQELEHGVCDITGLVKWLGKLLLCSCSPMRDPVVNAMVAKTQEAISAQDARQLVNAFKDLFGVLETMKLDVANHQIRYLRFYLLEDGIQFEQSQILARIAAGWSISHERRWFETAHDSPGREDRFTIFISRCINKIASGSDEFSMTFSADFDRLHALQQDFRLSHYHAACIATFRGTLHQLGWRGSLPDDSYARSMQNVWAVAAGLGQNFTFKAHSPVVLQIVTEAFQVCNISALPDSRTIFSATSCFQEALADTEELKRRVWDELENLVHLEAEVIFDMTPLEILNRYDPGPLTLPDASRKADLSIDSLARRTAHILVLHWRVWAPILYNQPASRTSSITEPMIVTPQQEMAERRRPRGSTSSVRASRPTIIPGQTIEHHSRTASLSQAGSQSKPSSYSPSSNATISTANKDSKRRPREPSV